MAIDAGGNQLALSGFAVQGFPGQRRTLPDLYYNRYRDYDPTTGRYIQADPIGLAGGASPYSYALNNPLRYTDPTGESPQMALTLGRVAARPVIQVVVGACFSNPTCWVPGAVVGAVGVAGYLAYQYYTLPDEYSFYPPEIRRYCPPPAHSGTILQMAKTTRRSGKERASDVPSWASGANPDPDENCKQFATRLLNDKYGAGNWDKSPGTEFSQIVKRCQRSGR